MTSKFNYPFGFEMPSNDGRREFTICYNKNGKAQRAVVRNYGDEDKRDYRIIEDNYYPRNRLTPKQRLEIEQAMNNNLIQMIGA